MLSDTPLDLAFVLGALGGPVCYAFGFVVSLAPWIPRAWRAATGVVTAAGAMAMVAYFWLWSQGMERIDTPLEEPPSATENGVLLASAVAAALVLVMSTWCVLRFRTAGAVEETAPAR